MDDDVTTIPAYDEMPLGTIRHRIRSLTEPQLRGLIDHEHQHGDRVPVLEVLHARLDELRAGATPTSGGESEPDDSPQHSRGSSPAGPSGAAEPSSPLRHGIAQPTSERGRPS